MEGPDHESLIRRWRQGDNEAFGDLFELHSSRLYTLAYRLTGGIEEARDLLQETALKAFTAGSQCQRSASVYAWFRRILMNLYLDNVRYQGRAGRDKLDHRIDWSEIEERSPAQDTPNPRVALEQQERILKLERALLSLDPPYRTILLLREVEGLAYNEIAMEMKVPLETVRTRLRRARAMMREMLPNLVEVA